MYRFKIFFSIVLLSFLLIITSMVKNETREIEKKIYHLSKTINKKEKNLFESQLDFYYLTSPSMIDKRIEHIDKKKYIPMEYSKIFLSINSFLELKKKYVNQMNKDEKKSKSK